MWNWSTCFENLNVESRGRSHSAIVCWKFKFFDVIYQRNQTLTSLRFEFCSWQFLWFAHSGKISKGQCRELYWTCRDRFLCMQIRSFLTSQWTLRNKKKDPMNFKKFDQFSTFSVFSNRRIQVHFKLLPWSSNNIIDLFLLSTRRVTLISCCVIN